MPRRENLRWAQRKSSLGAEIGELEDKESSLKQHLAELLSSAEERKANVETQLQQLQSKAEDKSRKLESLESHVEAVGRQAVAEQVALEGIRGQINALKPLATPPAKSPEPAPAADPVAQEQDPPEESSESIESQLEQLGFHVQALVKKKHDQ